MAAELPFDARRLAALFDIERRARGAADGTDLRFVAFNETRNVVAYDHAALLEPTATGLAVTAISDVPAVDRGTPWVQWLERVAGAVSPADEVLAPDPAALPDWERTNWRELGPPAGLFIPLAPPGREPLAWLWVAREADWTDADRFLFEHLGEVYGHALAALMPARARGGARRWLRRRRTWIAVAVVIVAVLAIPVRLTALAPAEIVARDPTVVAAPMRGVVEEILVEPNARVERDEPIVRLQDLEARNRFEVAREALEVARAKFRKARQEAFDSPESRARLATLRAEVALRETELRFARQKLEKVVIHADHAGIAIYDDPNDWSGRPVRTGERILQLADPEAHELRVRLPVSDAIVLDTGAPLKLFLDAHPLKPLAGEVVRTSYRPVTSGRDRVVYRVTA
ncbi:MAG: HlyD family efflux transporter periplasmic adaptor subunit, partial [Halofilum sp. (in: g-proteobacteria)]